MRVRRSPLGLTIAASTFLGLVSGEGCSSDSASDLGGSGTGAQGGATTDSSAGASGGGTTGFGGAAASGAAAGTGGGAGGGPPDASSPCEPPLDPTRAAICVQMVPEPIAFEADADFDGRGTLLVQVFDRPDPELPDGGHITPLAEAALGTPDALDLGDPIPVIRFDELPTTVYVRAVFVDGDPDDFPAPGFWLGGLDVSQGLEDRPQLSAVNLTAGAGKTVSVPLLALRRLRVDVGLAPTATAFDDAQGPAEFLVTATREVDGAALFGFGRTACANVGGGRTATIEGLFVGAGPYFLLATLDDFALGTSGGTLPPGSLTTLEDDGTGTLVVSAATSFTAPSDAYSHTVAVELTHALGIGDASAPASFSCDADGGAMDAATDASDASPEAATGDAATDASDAQVE